jgi:hypothetical protein
LDVDADGIDRTVAAIATFFNQGAGVVAAKAERGASVY